MASAHEKPLFASECHIDFTSCVQTQVFTAEDVIKIAIKNGYNPYEPYSVNFDSSITGIEEWVLRQFDTDSEDENDIPEVKTFDIR